MFDEIFINNVCSVFARQLALLDYLGDDNWNIDITKGTISFGTDKELGIQILGSESHHDNTWLWAWENKQSNLPEKLLTSVNKIKRLGKEKEIKYFTEPKFDLNEIDGHKLAMTCAGVSEELCYYVAPYEGGYVYIT